MNAFKALFAFVLVFAAGYLFQSTAQAQIATNVYWNPTNGVGGGGTGIWNSGGLFWAPNADGTGTLLSPNTNFVFNFAGTPGTVTESSSFTAAGINFLVDGYTWNPGSGASSTRTLTGNTAVNANASVFITNNANVNLVVAAGTNAGGFTFNSMSMTGGAGATVTLNTAAGTNLTVLFGSSSTTGGKTNSVNTIVSGSGNVFLGTASTQGFLQSGNITNNTSGLLTLTNSVNGIMTVSGAIANNGPLFVANLGSSASAVNLSGGISGSGSVTLSNLTGGFITNAAGAISNASVTMVNSGSGGVVSAGTITNGTVTMVNTSSGAVTSSGAISGNAALTLTNSGTGRIVLTASNSYSGGTTVYATGTGDIRLGDSALGTGTVTIAGAGTNYLRAAGNLNFANDFVINAGSTLRLGTTNSGSFKSTWSGAISGAGGIYYALSDAGLYLTGTNSSFGGGINNGSSGAVYVTSLGMAGANSSIGTNGTITLSSDSGSSGAGTIQWLGTSSEISDKNFALSAISSSTSQGVKIYAGDSAQGGTNVTLTLNGNINSTTTNNKVVTLGAYNGNTLVLNGSINQTVGYTTSVAINGISNNGTVILANSNNSFGGVVSINAGAGSTNTLQVAQIGNAGANSALGTNGTINVGGSSSTGLNILKYTGSGETSDKVINLAGTFGGATLDQSGTGNLKFTSAMTATGTGAKTITLQGSTAGSGEIASNIGDLGGNVISLTKSGSSLWTLSGSNSYTGATTIGAGTLRLTGVNAQPASGVLLGSSSTLNASTLDLAVGGAYVLGSLGNSTSAGGYMSFTNSSGSAATLTFTGATNSVTLSSSTSGGRQVLNNSTDLTVSFNGAVDIGSSTAGAVTFGGSGNTFLNGAIFNTNTALRGLTKIGSGTVTLAGANTYNGDTTVSAGSLIVASTGSISSSVVSISNGAAFRFNGSSPLSASITVGGGGAGRAVLGGSGTINSAVALDSLNDVLSPGNSPGILSLSQNQSWNSFTYDCEINNFPGTTAGTDFDNISIAGTLDLTGSSYGLNILSLTALNVPGNVPNFSETATSWTVLTASGGITGFNSGNWTIDASGFTTGTGYLGSFSLSQSGLNDILLTYTVPEPSSLALLGAAALGWGAWAVRRRLKS